MKSILQTAWSAEEPKGGAVAGEFGIFPMIECGVASDLNMRLAPNVPKIAIARTRPVNPKADPLSLLAECWAQEPALSLETKCDPSSRPNLVGMELLYARAVRLGIGGVGPCAGNLASAVQNENVPASVVSNED